MKKLLSALLAASLMVTSVCVTGISAATNGAAKGVTPSYTQKEFDDKNIVLTFGVTSDTHLSGSWNQERSVTKLSHMVEVFQKTAEDQNVSLDAILVNGDMIDSVKSGGNVQAYSKYGTKAAQNFREVNFYRNVLEGTETNNADRKNAWESGFNTVNLKDAAYGPGILGSGTRFFYCLGNHDEGGKGISDLGSSTYSKGIRGDGSGKFSTVYTAEYYAAIFCGWQYDYKSADALAADDGYDPSYREYVQYLVKMHEDSANASLLAEDKKSFDEKFSYTYTDGTGAEKQFTADDALLRFEYYYGNDTEYYADEYGLFYGNRHFTIGDDEKSRIHFLAIELSQSKASQDYLDKWASVSVAEDPTKPIFVLTHYKMVGTVYDSNRAGGQGLEKVMNKYPQIFIWGGHTHAPLANENGIMQKGYTAVDAGVLAYLSMGSLLTEDLSYTKGVKMNYPDPNAGKTPDRTVPLNQYTHENHDQGNCCWVQVDKNGNVKISRLDVYRSYNAKLDEDKDGKPDHADEPVFIKEPWVISGIDAEGSHLKKYSKETRLASNKAPEFPAAASATYTPVVNGSTKITFDAAIDDDMVKYYFIDIYDGETLVEKLPMTSFFTEVQTNEQLVKKYPTYSYTKTKLDSSKDYTFKVTAYDCWNTASEPLVAELDDKNAKVYKIGGVYSMFLDTSENPVSEYTMDGKKYKVLHSVAEADAAPFRIYFIGGVLQLSEVNKGTDAPLEIVGTSDKPTAIVRWNSGTEGCLARDLTFKNVLLDVTKTGDAGFTLSQSSKKGFNLVIEDCPTLSRDFPFFNTGWKSDHKSGSLTIKGESGPFGDIFPGPNYGDDNASNGDIVITIEGGTFTGSVGGFKNKLNNAINGNVVYNITGGNFEKNITLTTTGSTAIKGNAVALLLGGNYEKAGTVGHEGDSNISGKEVYVFKKSIYNDLRSKGKYTAPTKAITVIIPDSEGGIGDAKMTESGVLSSLIPASVAGKAPYVDGKPASEIALEDGKTYELTYGEVADSWSAASDWALEELRKANILGVIPECLIGADLTKSITRAEFAAVSVKVYEALSSKAAEPIASNPFKDTDSEDVLKAYNIGAVNGTSSTTFEPDALLEREQAATMLTRVYKKIKLEGWTLKTDSSYTSKFKALYTSPAPFADDAMISDWAKDSVYFMSANEIIKGVGSNMFAPQNTTPEEEASGYANTTREQALLIAARMVEKLK